MEIPGGPTHVWRNEHPLREFIVVQVSIKHREILDFGKSIQVRCDGVVAHKWAVGQRWFCFQPKKKVRTYVSEHSHSHQCSD